MAESAQKMIAGKSVTLHFPQVNVAAETEVVSTISSALERDVLIYLEPSASPKEIKTEESIEAAGAYSKDIILL